MWQKKSKLKHLPVLIIICCGWGFTAHKDLHAVACAGMPDEVWAFFKKHKNLLIELSVSADRRKHTDSTEEVKHYLDLDSAHYEVNESGELSEAIRLNFNLLSYLLSRIDSVDQMSIIRVAADLGHYIGDAHVPLHTTANYNGQYFNQLGIHALWETHVYELTKSDREIRKVNTHYIYDIDMYSDSIISISHSLVDKVLLMERTVRLRDGAPVVWVYRTRGRTLDILPTPAFCREYSDSLDNMVQIRFNDCADAMASVWYSAWVNGGSPDLEKFTREPNHDRSRLLQMLLELFWDEKLPNRQKQDTLLLLQ